MEENYNSQYSYETNSNLKSCQNTLLEILLDFDKLCRENGLEYIIQGGTAIGAIRHKGFIPWDDDIDVFMHSDDIEKLIKLWNEKADTSKYFLQYKLSDRNYNSVALKIRKNGTTCIDKRYTYVPMHWGIAIDIFPIYNAPQEPFLRKKMEYMYKIAYKIAKYPTKHFNWPEFIKNMFNSITVMLLNSIKKISDKTGKGPTIYRPSYYGEPAYLNREDIYPLTEYDFEGHKVLGANNAHKILLQKYGDYMQLPPEEKRVPSHQFIIDPYRDYSIYIASNSANGNENGEVKAQ